MEVHRYTLARHARKFLAVISTLAEEDPSVCSQQDIVSSCLLRVGKHIAIVASGKVRKRVERELRGTLMSMYFASCIMNITHQHLTDLCRSLSRSYVTSLPATFLARSMAIVARRTATL